MQNRQVAGILATALALVAVSGFAHAVDLAIGLGYEAVELQEKDVLRNETGGRAVAVLRYDNFARKDGGGLFGVHARGYFGAPSHNDAGAVIAGIKGADPTFQYNSVVDHIGGAVEVLAGYRNKGFWSDTDLDALFGVGIDVLNRTIHGGEDVLANPVPEEKIDHLTAYGVLGLGAYTRTGLWDNTMQVGFKLPVWSEVDWSLQPKTSVHGSSFGYFLRTSFDYAPAGEREYGMFFYYENTRWGDGPALSGIPALQTMSESYGIGLNFYLF